MKRFRHNAEVPLGQQEADNHLRQQFLDHSFEAADHILSSDIGSIRQSLSKLQGISYDQRVRRSDFAISSDFAVSVVDDGLKIGLLRKLLILSIIVAPDVDSLSLTTHKIFDACEQIDPAYKTGKDGRKFVMKLLDHLIDNDFDVTMYGFKFFRKDPSHLTLDERREFVTVHDSNPDYLPIDEFHLNLRLDYADKTAKLRQRISKGIGKPLSRLKSLQESGRKIQPIIPKFKDVKQLEEYANGPFDLLEDL